MLWVFTYCLVAGLPKEESVTCRKLSFWLLHDGRRIRERWTRLGEARKVYKGESDQVTGWRHVKVRGKIT